MAIEARHFVQNRQLADRLQGFAEIAARKVKLLTLKVELERSAGNDVAKLERDLTDAKHCAAGWAMAADCLRRTIEAERRMLDMLGLEPQPSLKVVEPDEPE